MDCQKRPSKRRPKALRLAKPLRKHHTARQKLEYLAYADQHGDKPAAKDLGVAPKSFHDWRAIKHVLEAQAKRGKLGKLMQHPGKITRYNAVEAWITAMRSWSLWNLWQRRLWTSGRVLVAAG